MTRSRLVFFAAMTVVVVGVAAGVGALWLNPARAAVGPLAGAALWLMLIWAAHRHVPSPGA